MTTTTEILFNVPFTAHCMGGCAIADSPERGAIDARNRVFDCRNLYVVDDSMLGANLGVNPSPTITALAERAMSFIPERRRGFIHSSVPIGAVPSSTPSVLADTASDAARNDGAS